MSFPNRFLRHLDTIVCSRLHLFHAFVFVLVFLTAARSQSQTLPPDSPSGFFPGTISIIAGGGTLSPNGNPASSSMINGLTAVAVDSYSNVYVAAGSALYIVYGGGTIPPVLGAVAPQGGLQKGDIYQVNNPSASCNSSNCGDGGPASQATFAAINALFTDATNNFYIADLTACAIRRIDYATQIVTTVAGQLNNCSQSGSDGAQIGDGGEATNATLQYPTDAKTDPAGNIYIADNGNGVIRVVYLNDPVPPILVRENISPRAKTNIYTVAGTPGQFCGAPNTCGDNGSALNAMFANVTSMDIDGSGNIYIADAGSNFTTPIIGGTVRMVYAGGTPIPSLLKIATGSPAAPNIYAVAGTESAACSTAPCGDGGPALQAQLNLPNYVRIDSTGDVYIGDLGDYAIRKVDAAGYISDIAGAETPGTGATSPTGNGGPATSAGFSDPLNFVFDSQNDLYIADSTSNFVVWEALPALPQTITFNPLEPVTYGTPPITLTATASSGLPVSYSVTGPARLSGSDLVITGTGTVQITASQQGDSKYAAAPSVTQSLTVNKALLTVTALPASITTKATQLPTFQAEFSGFVNGDTQQTAVSGTPAFSTTATLGQCHNSDNTYPINVSQGTLTAANYTFAFVPGTLTITGTETQTITFSPPSSVTYGQTTTVTLKAQASSGLPVQFTVISGPATESGSTVQITGGGVITIEAYQPGNCTYAAAKAVTQALTVNPAPLTVTGPAVSLAYGATVNPAQFPPPTITGFVGGDTQAIATGNAQYSAVSGTPQPGTYPIQVSQGTLALAPGYGSNYTFTTFVPGSLTITTASQAINFTQIPAFTAYGNSVTLTATASSGLPVVFSLTGPATFFANQNATNPSAGINTVTLNIIGVGAVTVTATQPGNSVYGAAQQVPQTFTVTPGVLTISASSATRTYGVPNPTLTYQISGFVNNDGDVPRVITGIPSLNTTATQQSPPGNYTITVAQGTLSAPNYTFNLVDGTLTVLPAGNYTLAATPPSLSIQSGHNGQTTIVITPNNDYQGTITLSCGSLPANISCIFSPATYTFNGNTNGGLENPLQGTLTITTMGGQTVVGALSEPPTPSGGPILGLLLPAGVTGLLITGRGKRLKNTRLGRLVIVTVLSLGAFTLASCGSGSTPALAAPGTTTITVNGVDAQNVSSSTPLTVTIQ